MNKKSMGEKTYKASISSKDLRSEVSKKVSLDKSEDFERKVEVNLVDTLALNDLVKKIKVKELTENDRRSEISEKISKKAVKLEEKIEENENNIYFDDRSEILGKFTEDEKSKRHIEKSVKRRENTPKISNKLEDTIALKEVVDKVGAKEVELKDKRNEIYGKFDDSSVNLEESANELKSQIINNEEEVTDKLEDKAQENVENISLAMVIFIVVVCLIVGAIVGYMLYKIAINNSI